jgi:hypothetical protein
MEVLFQIGKEIAELRSRVEALERKGCACRETNALLAQLSSTGHSRPVVPEPVPNEATLAASGVIHRVPRVPLLVNGTLLNDPRDISNYNGRPLFYTPLRTRSGMALAAFTDWKTMISDSKKMASAMAAVATASSEHICQDPPDSLPEQVTFFQDINESGDTLSLPPAKAYSDLTQVRHGFLGLGNWNDIISSVSWCRWDVSLFWDINFGGNHLWLPAGCNTPNLVDLGWNDEASAIVNWGQRFSSDPGKPVLT